MRHPAIRFALAFSIALSAIFVRAEDGEKTLMWKVTSDGGEVYLLGSIHLMKKEIYPLSKELEDAFARSKYLVLEADETKTDPAAMQKIVVEKGMYAGADDSIFKHLSEPVQESLNAYLLKNALPKANIEKLRPCMLSMALSVGVMMKLGFDPKMGIDKHFLDEAQAAGKKVLELESTDFQVTLLSGFSDELQEKFLASTLLEIDSMQKQIDKMVAAWSSGNAVEMDKLTNEHKVKHPELKAVFDKLIDDRNVGMTAKVEGYLKSKEVHFVIAGAAHMVGEKGIVKLLQDKKYKVEQIAKSGVKAPEPAGVK